MRFLWVFCALIIVSFSDADDLSLIHHGVSNWTAAVIDWQEKNKLCSRLTTLISKKKSIRTQLAAQGAMNITNLNDRLWLNLTIKELDSTYEMVFRSVGCLLRLLSFDLHTPVALIEGSRLRLESLRSETLREESEFRTIQELHNLRQNSQIGENETSIVDGLIKKVAQSADKLQNDLTDHVFQKALDNPQFKGAKNVEAVIRVDNSESGESKSETKSSDSNTTKPMVDDTGKVKSKQSNDPKSENAGKVVNLIDAHDNTYVLSKGMDSTVPLEDSTFIKDLVLIITLGTLLGGLCQLIGLPSMFGHVMSGIVLGPSTLGLIKSVVQIETLGQFGVYLILFTVGLEFSPRKVRPLLKVSVITSLFPMVTIIAACILIGRFVTNHATVNESAFVGACLSLSSTPLVVNFLTNDRKEETGLSDYGRILLAILILQDVYLALIMALLPTLADTDKLTEANPADIFATYTIQILHLTLVLICILALVGLFMRFLAAPVFSLSRRLGGRELSLLVLLSCCVGGQMATFQLGISRELGSFLAGVIFSGCSLHDVEPLVTPLRDTLATVFFASIGLHVFPRFLGYEIVLLSIITLSVVTIKFLSFSCLLYCFMPRYLDKTTPARSQDLRKYKWLVAAGLAQVSEFSFVLGSSARKLGLCSREVYLLILGVTTLSLLLAPLPWKLVMWSLRGRPRFSLPTFTRCSRLRMTQIEDRTSPDGSPLIYDVTSDDDSKES